MPMRFAPSEPGRVYRKISHGPLVDVFLLDMRSYRGPNGENRQTTYGPEAHFLGPAQVAWLKRALLASRAVWRDGTEHPMNRPRTRPGLARRYHDAAAAAGARQIRTASFVSVLIDARAVREDGLPRAAYFLWNDDFEFTARILRRRVGLYVPGSVVRHLTKALGSSDADPGDRFRFETRNKVWTFRDSPAFGPLERAAFETATARRWARTVIGSRDRARLGRAARTGLAEALAPQPDNTEVLIGTPVQDDVLRLESGRRA